MLNLIRADSFDAYIATMGKGGTVTEAEAKVLGNLVNVTSGRGPLGPLKGGARLAAGLFFSPRWQLSRFQLVLGQPFYKKGSNLQTTKLVAAEYARAIAGVGVFMSGVAAALYAALGPPGEDEEWNIEVDPLSSDFMKIRIGETRIDPLFGLSQVTVFLNRFFRGKTKTRGGETISLRGEDKAFGQGTLEVTSRFLRNKLAPVPGALFNIISGENFKGDKTTAITTAGDLLVPITYQNVLETMKAQGIPAGTALALLEVFGMSVQQYDELNN